MATSITDTDRDVPGITITKGQEQMYHPEKLATYGTQKKKTTRTHMCWTQLYTHKHKYGK
jgi:hypothetical protein